MKAVCVAFKAHLGWVNTAAVALHGDSPRCLDARRIDLVDPADRETAEPYHVAGGWHGLTQHPRPADPAGIIKRGRRRQVRSATGVLQDYRAALDDAGLHWRLAVMLVGRGRLRDDLEHILGSHAQIHVAEGEAIRAAARAAFRTLGVDCVDQDEKDVLAEAADALQTGNPDGVLKSSARPDGPSTWRKEERLLTMAAWLCARRSTGRN